MTRPLLTIVLLLACSGTTLARQPNIVLLLADDLGYGELGCQGNPQIPTPRIDSIAKDGIRFTSGYVTAPNCSPSRAGLLTGKIPMRFGYEFNPIGARNEDPAAGLPPSETTIAEMLHGAGYATGLFGKWHLGGTAKYHPQRHGFDEFFGFLHEGHFFVPPPYEGVTTMLRRKTLPGNRKGRYESGSTILTTHMGHNEPPYDTNNPVMRDSQPVHEVEYLTDAFTREACSFMRRHRERPFFLYLAYNAVHSPLQGLNAHMERNREIEDVHRRIFASMLTNLDDNVGRVLDTISELDLDEETLVIFLSDNGGPTRELTSSNAPLRGEKSSMYEGGLRVPFLMRWTGHLPEGKVVNEPVWTPDLFPTAVRLANIDAAAPVPQPRGIDGIDLMPLLTGQEQQWPQRTFFWRQGKRTAVLFTDSGWKLVNMTGSLERPSWEIHAVKGPKPNEHNLLQDSPEELKSLKGELLQQWTRFNNQMQPSRF